jgi:hypothetical protein
VPRASAAMSPAGGVIVASAGGEIDQPEFAPKSKAFVAVKVAPPLAVTPCTPPQLRVQAPLGHEIVVVLPKDGEPISIGSAGVPARVKALEIVHMTPLPNERFHPEPHEKFAKVFAVFVKFRKVFVVVALIVILL